MLPEAVKTYIHTHRQEAVDTLSKLIGFPSVATPQPQDGFPYGKPRRSHRRGATVFH